MLLIKMRTGTYSGIVIHRISKCYYKGQIRGKLSW